MNSGQQRLIMAQFGPRAAAYVESAVHAQGADLDHLVEILRNRPAARVLDLGCGGGHVSYHVAPHVREVVAYDLSPEMLDVVARAATERGLTNIATKQGVAENLPFDDVSFDFVMSRYSAHHWRDLDGGLREVVRVLKPGGVAAMVDSLSPGLPVLDTYLQAVEVLRDPSHVRNYSRLDWVAALTRAGFLIGAADQHRVRLHFASWIERMNTPKVQSDAIRALQTAMSETVVRHFNIGPDGSFDLDVLFVEAAKRA